MPAASPIPSAIPFTWDNENPARWGSRGGANQESASGEHGRLGQKSTMGFRAETSPDLPFNEPCRTTAVRCHRQLALTSQGAGPRYSKLSEPKINQFLTKLVYLEFGHSGRVCWLSGQPLA